MRCFSIIFNLKYSIFNLQSSTSTLHLPLLCKDAWLLGKEASFPCFLALFPYNLPKG